MITTRAIVLGLRQHTDRSSILQLYTRAEGRINVLVYGPHAHKRQQALFQPLTIIDVTYNTKRALPTLESIESIYLPVAITANQYKRCIGLFITEIILLTLTHAMEDSTMYEFLALTIRELDQTENPNNLHISFMTELADLLGIGINPSEHPELLKQPLTRHERQQTLQALCTYYTNSLDTFRTPKSLEILMEVFD